MITLIQKLLTPDLLKKGQVADPACPVKGHCYVASEAIYHLGCKDQGYRPHVGRVPLEHGGGTHWWLQNPEGERVDATSAQFDADTLARIYSVGCCCGFLTQKPSARARKLMLSFAIAYVR